MTFLNTQKPGKMSAITIITFVVTCHLGPKAKQYFVRYNAFILPSFFARLPNGAVI